MPSWYFGDPLIKRKKLNELGVPRKAVLQAIYCCTGDAFERGILSREVVLRESRYKGRTLIKMEHRYYGVYIFEEGRFFWGFRNLDLVKEFVSAYNDDRPLYQKFDFHDYDTIKGGQGDEREKERAAVPFPGNRLW